MITIAVVISVPCSSMVILFHGHASSSHWLPLAVALSFFFFICNMHIHYENACSCRSWPKAYSKPRSSVTQSELILFNIFTVENSYSSKAAIKNRTKLLWRTSIRFVHYADFLSHSAFYHHCSWVFCFAVMLHNFAGRVYCTIWSWRIQCFEACLRLLLQLLTMFFSLYRHCQSSMNARVSRNEASTIQSSLITRAFALGKLWSNWCSLCNRHCHFFTEILFRRKTEYLKLIYRLQKVQEKH